MCREENMAKRLSQRVQLGSEQRSAELTRLRQLNAELVEGLTALVNDVRGLVSESNGVYGLHLNGDVSPWPELLPDGEFERLGSLMQAKTLIARAKEMK